MATCSECSESFTHTHRLQRYCTVKCRNVAAWRRRSKALCRGCGQPTGYAPGVKQEHLCLPCRRAREGYRDKTPGRIVTWDCLGCGKSMSRPATRGQVPKWCDGCRRSAKNHGSGRQLAVSSAERFAIYARDRWTCWLCEEPVESGLIGSKSLWRPSLDHVVPASRGGSDDHSNLRLAHMWCNSVRSDGRTYTPEVFRAAS